MLLLIDSCDYPLLLNYNLSLILPCISLWLTGWHWLLRMQIWISASLLVCLHFWHLACLRFFVIPSARHCTYVVACLLLTNMLSILASCALLCLHSILRFRPTPWWCKALVLSVASLQFWSCLICPMFPLLFGVCRVLVFLRGPVVVCGPALWSYSLVWKLLSVIP